ncbi:MAG: FkbM family methyltransferase [Phycisphaerae bacterium]|nr:FkbM family methyltransferase [Phycisphaerae bacterium]MDW8261198.1 FkbM family methyltransferase [Phycisphaerales bacterium]
MILKAEYVFRPSQILRRWRTIRQQDRSAGLVPARLPWGRVINVNSRDNIGSAVLTLGVYDLVVTETLWRLTDPDDLALDVGANVGCMTAALAERAGEVECFEPHPILYRELVANLESLRAQGVRAVLRAHCTALGAAAGELPLVIPDDFARHRGESTLSSAAVGAESIPVQVKTLDSLLPAGRKVGILKLDVEGFERQVLAGAQRLLESGRLRDCIFEEHRAYPTDVTDLLESCGFRVFRLARRLTRPELLNPDSKTPRSHWEATSFLATRDPQRAIRRMATFGWRCLGR